MDCIFCKIVAGEIPSSKVHETETTLAFDDISPRAPVHTLVIPKKHLFNVNNLGDGTAGIMDDIFRTVQQVVKTKGIGENGYRILINNGPAAHQEVGHLHVHVFGGVKSLGPMLCFKKES